GRGGPRLCVYGGEPGVSPGAGRSPLGNRLRLDDTDVRAPRRDYGRRGSARVWGFDGLRRVGRPRGTAWVYLDLGLWYYFLVDAIPRAIRRAGCGGLGRSAVGLVAQLTHAVDRQLARAQSCGGHRESAAGRGVHTDLQRVVVHLYEHEQ